MKQRCAQAASAGGQPAAFGRLCVETNRPSLSDTSSPQPPSGGCVLKQLESTNAHLMCFPAAFGRLCVETSSAAADPSTHRQPPSGGCVLKLNYCMIIDMNEYQPPSGGCVLKLNYFNDYTGQKIQPPSGGCVLKLVNQSQCLLMIKPAAFGRLCVETCTSSEAFAPINHQPPSGGCVLKPGMLAKTCTVGPSRLRAAVC